MKRRAFLALMASSATAVSAAAAAQPDGEPEGEARPDEDPSLTSPDDTGLAPGLTAAVVPWMVRFGGALDPVDAFLTLPPRC